jgi:CRISPR/Cas system-associated exonuclease Cas4 (RecB family)
VTKKQPSAKVRDHLLLGTASKLSRTLRCAPSALLPEDPPRDPSEMVAANRGTAIHTYLEQPEDGLGLIPEEYHDFCKSIDLSYVAGQTAPPHYREVSLAFHPESGECKEILAYEEVDEDWVAGTADVVIPGFAVFEVYDYKTGKSAPKALDNEQLMFLALCVQKVYSPRATRGIIGIQHITHKGVVKTDTRVVDVLELELFGEMLKAKMRDAKQVKRLIQLGKTPQVNRGKWCYWCDRKNACPAMQTEETECAE